MKSKSNSHKRSKNERQAIQASLQTTADERAVNKFFGHTWKEGTSKAQTSPAYTQPIHGTVRSWVRGKRAWFGGGERGKCPARMTHYPNGQN